MQLILGFHNLNDFPAFVLAAMRASAMRANLFVAVRALGELGDRQSIVSASSRGAALRVAAFWIRHGSLSFSILFQ